MSDQLDEIFAVIRHAGTLESMRAFLRGRDLPFSAAKWDDMFDVRLRPLIEEGRLTVKNLLGYLRDAEEFGRQHTFLYRPRAGTAVPRSDQAMRWLRAEGLAEIATDPVIVDKPEELTLTEYRREAVRGGDLLTIKAVEMRKYQKRVSDHIRGTVRTVTYNIEEMRAVNIVRVHPDGLLEIRIYSHRAGPDDYAEQLTDMWSLLSGLLAPTGFAPISLMRAKQKLWKDRATLQSKLRYRNSDLVNDEGFRLHATTPTLEASLFDNQATDESLDRFIANDTGHCDGFNVWWKQSDSGAPSEDIHVIIAGEEHEFAVTQKCRKEDYEHVLAELRRFNR